MKTFGLIGYPLSHSFSPTYFSEKFEREKIENAEYKLFPLNKIQKFPSLLKQESGLCGLNVTIPYKEEIIAYLDKLDESAKEIGAVNCIKVEKNRKQEKGKIKLVGYNTDAFGFENSLKKYLKIYHKKALILGTGGASKAVKYVLTNLNIEFLFVSRNRFPGNCINFNSLDKKIIKEYSLIINTTPLGMFPSEKTYPSIPYQYITEEHLLFDLVYNPSETLFMNKGKSRGATVMNGFEMLRLQAEKSWEIWNNAVI